LVHSTGVNALLVDSLLIDPLLVFGRLAV